MILSMMHDHLYYSQTASKVKNYKTPLSDRQDVINKALLRSIRRFYLEEFRNDNECLAKQRYRQVPGAMILNGFKDTCRRLFGDIPNLHQISQFLMIISSINSMNKYPFNKRISAKGEQVSAMMYKYSYAKFQKLFEIEEFEFVFKYIYNNHRERIFKLCTKKEIENKEPYNQMLDTWITNFAEYNL